MKIRVRPDDLSSRGVQELLGEHLAAMHDRTPPGHVHALAVDGLRAPEITLWTARLDGHLCGCGALKELSPTAGEIKSMHTRPSFQRRGVGQAVLTEILRAASERGYREVYLETGSGPEFEAAHAFYARNGFTACGPFGDYEDTAFNAFMMNDLSLPVGERVSLSLPVPRPDRSPLVGTSCTLEPLLEEHAGDLIAAETDPTDPSSWTYMSYGPFESVEAYAGWIRDFASGEDPLFFAIRDHARNQVTGVASYLRIEPDHATIEVGHIHYSPLLQRTRAATEAMYLMMRQAFELGYRRYEWKCHSLNAASRCAADRLGFSFEGIHRQALVMRGRNRDTAWYSVLDREWPARQAEFERWLDAANFDSLGAQRTSLHHED